MCAFYPLSSLCFKDSHPQTDKNFLPNLHVTQGHLGEKSGSTQGHLGEKSGSTQGHLGEKSGSTQGHLGKKSGSTH